MEIILVLLTIALFCFRFVERKERSLYLMSAEERFWSIIRMSLK